MALMDAGIKWKKPVSGIAMGLITDGKENAVLSDILDDEDHLGDMDFKVTGTADGITACQMDIKIKDWAMRFLVKALKQAREGRLHILEKLTDTIAEQREMWKPHAPKIVYTEMPRIHWSLYWPLKAKHPEGNSKRTQTTIVISERTAKES